MEKVIVLTGPTAVGKSKVALEIAKKFNFDIINGDAFQIYKYMDIGTAKPSIEERKQVKHLLFDFLDPKESFSIYDYQKLVRKEIEAQISNNKIPFIVGGSGLYINSVIYDYQFDDQKRTNEFHNLTSEEIYQRLIALDPDTSVDINNRKRLERALELKTNSNSQVNSNNRHQSIYDSLVFFLIDDRECLYERINKRVDQMFEEGLLAEFENLYPDKISTQALLAIGYKELVDYVDGKASKEATMELIKKHTRNYAKRQITWFKHQTKAIWININDKSFDAIISEISNHIINFLKQ